MMYMGLEKGLLKLDDENLMDLAWDERFPLMILLV